MGNPVIEDDVYGDVCFGAARPKVAKAYDRKGLVLWCSSFSKTWRRDTVRLDGSRKISRAGGAIEEHQTRQETRCFLKS